MQQSYATAPVELEVQLRPSADGGYSTKMTANGVAATGFIRVSPRDDWSVAPPSHYGSAEKAITRSSQVATRDRAVDVGRQLFRELFSGSLRSLYERIAKSGPAIRLRIASDDLAVLSLPWELLYDEARGDFLSLATESSVLRLREPHLGPVLTPVPTPLRVLVVTADETGTLAAGRDVDLLTTLTDAASYVKVEKLEHASMPMLEERLRDRSKAFHVLHFAGTGGIGSEGKRKRQMLQLEPPAEGQHPLVMLAPEQLAEWLRPAESDLRFVYLNACNTDEFAATLSGLVPAVLGIRGDTSIDGCTTFAHTFYRALVDGAPIDLASWYARREHETVLPGRREWANMTLYVAGSGPLVHELDVLGAARDAPPMTSPGDSPDTRHIDLLRRKKSMVERNLDSIKSQLATLGDAAPDAIHSEQVRLTKELDAVSSELAGAE